MKILILHGIGGHAGIHWQKWLHDELRDRGHNVLMPELPESAHPNRQAWVDTVKQSLADTTLEELIIVGHSLGVATALDFLEQTRGRALALVSVSGFGDDYGAKLNSYFMRERSIGFDEVRRHIVRAAVIYGDDDPYVPQQVLGKLADDLKVLPEVIPGGGHLNSSSGYSQFPRLLEIVLDFAR